MFEWLIKSRGTSAGLSTSEWREAIDQVLPHLDSHSLYVGSESGTCNKLQTTDQDVRLEQTLSFAIAYDVEGVEPWQTEIPARHMAEKLGNVLGRELAILLSRSADHYAGYYVHITAQDVS